MKAASFSTGGFRQLDRLLAKMASVPADRKAITTVLRRGGNVIAREERATIHVVSGRTRDSITVTTRPGFDVSRDFGDVVVFVGPRKGGAGSRAHLLEWGSSHIRSRPGA